MESYGWLPCNNCRNEENNEKVSFDPEVLK